MNPKPGFPDSGPEGGEGWGRLFPPYPSRWLQSAPGGQPSAGAGEPPRLPAAPPASAAPCHPARGAGRGTPSTRGCGPGCCTGWRSAGCPRSADRSSRGPRPPNPQAGSRRKRTGHIRQSRRPPRPRAGLPAALPGRAGCSAPASVRGPWQPLRAPSGRGAGSAGRAGRGSRNPGAAQRGERAAGPGWAALAAAAGAGPRPEAAPPSHPPSPKMAARAGAGAWGCGQCSPSCSRAWRRRAPATAPPRLRSPRERAPSSGRSKQGRPNRRD